MVQEDEETKDDADIEDKDIGAGEIEVPEGELHDEKEPDFTANVASSSFADEVGEDEEDPYESFNGPVAKDDSQLDPYGVGAPSGFANEDDEDFLEEEEEEVADTDSNAF
jgi:hypothetical protein